MTKFVIVSNYLADHKRAYIAGWDRTFNEFTGLSTGNQIEIYLVDVLKDRSYLKVPVGYGKQIARDIGGIRIKDASAIVVNEESKNSIIKHFAPELNKTFWVKETAE
jgi:hypothetical protein